jgi:uncharacterized protein
VQQGDQVQVLIWKMVCSIVDRPEKVNVESIRKNDLTCYRVHVEGRDVGHVIGKAGRTARALRTILAAIAQKEKRRLELDIAADSALAQSGVYSRFPPI